MRLRDAVAAWMVLSAFGCQAEPLDAAKPVPTEVAVVGGPSAPTPSPTSSETAGAAAAAAPYPADSATAGLPRPPPGSASAAVRPEEVIAIVEKLRPALAAGDIGVFADLAHPTKGVRFEPYVFLEDKPLVVLTSAEIRVAWSDPKVRRWGSYDGSGDPIDLSFRAYFDRFVRIPDPAKAQLSVDRVIGSGNTINNIRDVYPNATILELNFPGKDPAMAGMDWQSVRFVLERQGTDLAIVAIVHDEWTI